MQKTNNMVSGNPTRLLIRFALPLMAGYICQQVYTIVDSAVVGRLIGVDAFATVGATALYYWTAFSIILGLTQGFGILLAQRFGAGDEAGMKRGLVTAGFLSGGFAILLTAASLILTRPVLGALNTPLDIIDGAATYLYYMFSGIPIVFAYNLAGALLRAMGNSKAPLWAVLYSSVINIVLDVLFVAVFGLGIAGVAIATLISQAFSFCYCLWVIMKIPEVRITKADIKVDSADLLRLLKLGLPLALRDGVISIGGLAVQYVINGYGTLFVAGMAAPKKLYGIMELIGGGMEGAVATFVGQNYGAGELARVRAGVQAARKISIIGSCVMTLIFLICGRWLLSVLFSGDAVTVGAVLDIGYAHLASMALALPALYMLFVHRSALSGMGDTLMPMLSGFTELVMRIIAVMILPMLFAEWGVYIAESVGWIGAALLLFVAYRAKEKKIPDITGGDIH